MQKLVPRPEVPRPCPTPFKLVAGLDLGKFRDIKVTNVTPEHFMLFRLIFGLVLRVKMSQEYILYMILERSSLSRVY